MIDCITRRFHSTDKSNIVCNWCQINLFKFKLKFNQKNSPHVACCTFYRLCDHSWCIPWYHHWRDDDEEAVPRHQWYDQTPAAHEHRAQSCRHCAAVPRLPEHWPCRDHLRLFLIVSKMLSWGWCYWLAFLSLSLLANSNFLTWLMIGSAC